MAKKQDRPQVFVSAAAKDRALARVLAHQLRAKGWQPFIASQEIELGESWLDAIVDAVRASRVVVVLLTPQSLQTMLDSDMLVAGGAAMASEKPLVTVLAGVSASEIPSPLKGFQAVTFDRFDIALHMLERELAQPA